MLSRPKRGLGLAAAIALLVLVGGLPVAHASTAPIDHSSPNSVASARTVPAVRDASPSVPTGSPAPATSSSPIAGTAVVALVRLGTFAQPEVAAYDPVNKYVFAPDYAAAQVSIVSTLTNSVVATHHVALNPFSATYDARNGWVYVANAGAASNVTVFNGTTAVASIVVGGNPHYAAYDPVNGFVYVADTTANQVSILNGTTLVANVSTDVGPERVVYSASTGWMYVLCSGGGNVVIVNGTAQVANLTVGSNPSDAVLDPDNGLVYVSVGGTNQVVVLNGTRVGTSISVGAAPGEIAFDPDNGLVYVADAAAGNVSILNGTAVVATVPVGNNPSTLAFNPSAGLIYVAARNDDNVTAISGTQVVAEIAAPTYPGPLLYDPDSGDEFVSNFGSGILERIGTNVTPYAVTFREMGLPSGTNWSATIGPTTLLSNGPTLLFGEPNGTYPYGIGAVPGFLAPPAGSATVSGANLTVPVDFVPAYNVTFNETGLPATTPWTVTLNGSSASSSGASVSFSTGNGSYPYSITPIAGFSTQWSGTVVVSGHPTGVSVLFVRSVYTLTFSETGLPVGTAWNVTIGAAVYSSNGTTLGASEPNGTYPFVARAGDGFGSMQGSVVVVGEDVNVSVSFQVPTYPVDFTESGLPPGTIWSVTADGEVNSTSTSMLSFSEPNGTHPYLVALVPGFTTTWNGTVVVMGVAVGVAVAFAPVAYSVTFDESGLPGGTTWTVELGGQPGSSDTSALVFEEPNGTGSYSVTPVPGYTTSYFGSVDVLGAPVLVNVVFVEWTYPVEFTESGLPSGTLWGVTIGGVPLFAQVPKLTAPLPNGTSTFSVIPVPGYTTAWTGSVLVDAATTSRSVDFTRVTYAVSFSETGLTSPINWSVSVEGLNVTSTTSRLVVEEPNGTYPFEVEAVAGYTTPVGGTVTVEGNSTVIAPIAFSPSAPPPNQGTSPDLTLDAVLIVGIAVVALAIVLVWRRSRRPGPGSAPSEEAAEPEVPSEGPPDH